MLLIGLALFFTAVGFYCLNRRQPVLPTEIYQGVEYCCERLEIDDQGSGLVHWVRVDLTAPGIELYVTPLDHQALVHGWQFKLQCTGTVVKEERLAVGINATYFTSDSGWVPMPGDFARAMEATVADYRVSHIPEHTYLLCFDDQSNPSFEISRPPNDSVLRRSRWALGGRGAVLLTGAQISKDAPKKPTD